MSTGLDNWTTTVVSVPEPSTAGLLVVGVLAGIGFWVQRRKATSATSVK